MNGQYNFAADSFKWSQISISGNTTVLKGLTNFNFRSVFSPYQYDNLDKITKKTVWSQGKILPEFRNFSGQFSTGVSFRKIFDMIAGKEKTDLQDPAPSQNNSNEKDNKAVDLTKEPETDLDGKVDKEVKENSLADWFENFNISHALNFEILRKNGSDTFFVSSHSINVSGNIPLTKNWSMNIGNIAYDFKNKSFVYPYFSFARDLHCWQMNFTWAPANGVYSFFIGVKSSTLSFLKFDYGQRNANTLFTGRF
ncbi:MAG: hypothetical protein IPO92_12005 [Saprospiraceae bacterium]|nr:hypothetical protein [Saprospiraceae bacterium]